MTDGLALERVDDGLANVELPPALAAIRAAIAASLDDLRDLEAADDLNGILVGIAVIDVIRKDLADLRQAAGVAAAERMDSKQVALEGIGLFERKAAAKRVTDWDAILSLLESRAVVDPATGEVVDDPREAVSRLTALFRKVVPLYRSTGAKQAVLSEAGIDRDAVQDTEWRAPDVVFRASK